MNFAHPSWLFLLLLVPVLVAGAILVSRLKRQQWQILVAQRLRERLFRRSRSLPRWVSLTLLLAACSVITIALARPRGDAGTRTEKTIGRNVMIALDISRSMRVADVKPDRLAQAKVAIYELLEAMPNERIGFVGFAGNAHVYAPLTIDHSAVREIVDQMDETWAPLGGSDLSAAVSLATDTLKKTGQKNNALVIISDGDKHDGNLEAMISDAEQAGVYIIAIGVGTEDGGFVPHKDFPGGQMVDRDGRTVISRMHPDVMRKLAEGTKGRFAVIGTGLNLPTLVKSVVKDLDAFEMEGREQRISVEFYQWLIFPAIVLLTGSILAGTRWKGLQNRIQSTALIVGGLMGFSIPDAKASDASDAKAALTSERYDDARGAYQKLADKTKLGDQRARFRLGQGLAAYRAGDFRASRTAFSQAMLTSDPRLKASGHLGVGNSLFQLAWKGLSGEPYPSASGSVPDLDRFDILVKEALAKLGESNAPEEGETGGFTRFESLITNWADAVRHYESALALAPPDPTAPQNRDLSLTYLRRLQELLKQEKEQTEESMPQPEPGQGQPQEGQGDGDPQKGNGKGEEEQGEKGKGNEPKKDGDGGRDQEKKGENKAPEKDPGPDPNEDPNESPQDRANRILKENADLEKGPISPGRREFRDAPKDW
jgi:Ca-activated chloride channel family protein